MCGVGIKVDILRPGNLSGAQYSASGSAAICVGSSWVPYPCSCCFGLGHAPHISAASRPNTSRRRSLLRRSHSQTVNTRHPAAYSSFLTRSSRSLFLRIFSSQNLMFDFGSRPAAHPTCPCQKQPLTITTVRYRLSTISGFPGSRPSCTLYLNPHSNRNFLTTSSGRVFFPLIALMIRLLTSLSSSIYLSPTVLSGAYSEVGEGWGDEGEAAVGGSELGADVGGRSASGG